MKNQQELIVTCESCNTKFRLDPSRLKAGKRKLRCSRCGNVFSFESNEEEVQDKKDILEEPVSASMETEFPPSFYPSPPPARKRLFSLPVIIVFAVVLFIAGGTLWTLKQHSSILSDQGAGEKGKGGTDQLSAIKVLNNIQPYFSENAQVGQIFVVAGEVVNESSRPVSFVMIEGRLYNNNYTPIMTQRCYLGNVLSPEDLSRLSITEIQNRMMNREGKNLSNVNIPKGKHIPFMLVFHNLPELKTLSDYSIEVISAQFD